MKLVYIHYVGKSFECEHIYEFLFSLTPDKITGEEWDSNPASGNPLPPTTGVDLVGKISTTLFFETIQESSVFCMQDTKDGLIALAWEDEENSIYDSVEKSDHKMFFKFGELKEDVDKKLYERDLTLQYKERISIKK